MNNCFQPNNLNMIRTDCSNVFVSRIKPEYNFHLPGPFKKGGFLFLPHTDASGEINNLAVIEMDNFDLEPKYTANEVPGKCLKCLAEKELDSCLFGLLSDQTSDTELQQRYQALLALLQSPDFERLRSQAERLLSEGKQVKVKVDYEDGELTCELISV